MAMNQIPFQQGLSMPEFFARYGIEPHCARALATRFWLSASLTKLSSYRAIKRPTTRAG